MYKSTLNVFVKILLSILFFITGSTNLSAQLSSYIPNIVPSSPEAASLGKFVEVPVSHYTGLPDITIPLYTIESGEIKFPIEVSYHARGIQVSEIASRVGTGWTLKSGGTITRQVRGQADESPYGYLTKNYYSTFFTSEETRRQVFSESIYGRGEETIDLQPDMFFFNFLNFSGKFIFDQKTKLPVIQKFSDFKIVPIFEWGYYIKGWIITDKEGVKYYFGTSYDGLRTAIDKPDSVSNYTYNEASGLQQPTESIVYNNSWQLLDIITPTQRQVKFEYEKDNPVYFVKNYDEGTNSQVCSSFSRIFQNQSHIKTIYFDKGKVVFTKSIKEREDLARSFALEKVEIFGADNAIKAQHTFNYNYTNSHDVNLYEYLRDSDPQSKKRMFLQSITTKGSDITSDTKKTHSFVYDGIVLPNRFSTAQDNWGYYNAQNNGRFLPFFTKGNREVDTIKSEAGMLKKIIYPTGGTAVFEYEHNKVIASNYYKNLLTNTTNPTINRTASIIKDPVLYNGNYFIKKFTVGAAAPAKVYASSNVIFSGNTKGCLSNAGSRDCSFDVYVYKISPESKLIGGIYIGRNANSIILPGPGEYRFEVRPKTPEGHDPENFEAGFSVTLNWIEPTPEEEDQPLLLYAAGKRIKRIIWNDNSGSTTSKTYKYLTSSGGSSGKTFSMPNMYYISDRDINNVPILKQFGSTAGSPLTNFQGNAVGYSFVTEINGEENKNIGKTEYTFTIQEDTGDFYKFPYHPPTDNEWLRGMPLNIKHYTFNNNNYSLIKEINNTYLYGDEMFSPTYFAGMLDPDSSYSNNKRKFSFPLIIFIKDEKLSGADAFTNPNSYKEYYATGGTVDLYSNEETEILKNSGKYQKSTKYFYNYDLSNQLRKTETKSSVKEILSTKYFYPQDPEMASEPFVNDLIAQNIIGIPLKTETYRGATKISQQKTVYDKSVTTSNLLLPKYQLENKGSAALNPVTDKVISFDLYDDKGNVMQYTKDGSVPVSIVWGYNKTLPVAIIENIAYKSIPTSLITEAQTASDIGTEESMFKTINNFSYSKEEFGNTMISTYVHKPLIGVSMIKNAMNVLTYFTYDSFGRLQFVKDGDGNLLSENQYHYKE